MDMKSERPARKVAYVGAAAGLVVFAIVGLLPSSFVGGVLGLKIAGHIFGKPLGTMVLPRVIVGLTMVLGVLVASIVFVAGGMIMGWTIGNVIGALKITNPVRAYFTGSGKTKKASKEVCPDKETETESPKKEAEEVWKKRP